MNGCRDVRFNSLIFSGLILIFTTVVSSTAWAQAFVRCLEEGDLRTIGADVPRDENVLPWPPVKEATTLVILDDPGPTGSRRRAGELLIQSDKASGRVVITERRAFTDLSNVKLAPDRSVTTEPQGPQDEALRGPDSRCIVRDPDSNHLFEVTGDGRLIEMTADGTVVRSSPLDASDASVDWGDVQACAIAPSADSTDAENKKHLFIATGRQVCEFEFNSN